MTADAASPGASAPPAFSGSLLEQAVEQTRSAIMITNHHGDIEYVNAAFTAITGYALHEVIGRNPRFLKSGRISPETYASMWEALQDGTAWKGRVCNRHKDGHLYWEDQTITPVCDASGTVTHFISIKEDITEAIQSEQLLVQAQKMEAVGQLTGGLAHDFSNLLGIISGSLSLHALKLPPGAERQHLDTAIATVKRGTEITRALLAVARRRPLNPVVTDINALITELDPLIRQTAGPTIDVAISATADAPLVEVDPGGLNNAILNLVINARDAMPAGGRLVVYAYSLWVKKELEVLQLDLQPGEYVVVGVDDDGAGMTPEVAAKAFEPFFTTKETGKGTGLGLSMVYGFCRQSGGIARLDSAPGHGTSIQLLLPAQDDKPPRAATPAVAKANEPPRQYRILIADDDAELLARLRDHLAARSYEVSSTVSPAKALSMLASQRHDLLVTGLVVPSEAGDIGLAASALAIDPQLRILCLADLPAMPTPAGVLAWRLAKNDLDIEQLGDTVAACLAEPSPLPVQ